MPPPMARGIAYLVIAVAFAAFLGGVLKPWVGWLVWTLALLGQVAYHLIYFSRLERWSRQPANTEALEGEGMWDDVFARIYRHEKKLLSLVAQRETEVAEFSSAIQALTDGIVLLDGDNRITWCNVTAETQFGITLRTDLGQHLANLVRRPEFVDYMAAGDFVRPLTLRSDRSGDRVLSVHVLPYGRGNRLMQVKDVTQADLLDRMRRDFVANVSHELRTPLTVLAGFLETLQEIELEPYEQRHYLELMSDQSQRMQRIVRDLLTLSSLEAAPPPENEVIDMATLLDKLKRDAEALSGGRHRIVLEAEGGDLRGAEGELISAMANLVTNAVRYTPEGGTVTISWRSGSEGGEFAVQDTGIGIDPQHIPRLTERFYRVDRGRSRDTGGTGLGLAIVKHALVRHQAGLDITSTPGKGSRFAVRFPTARLVGP
ncbi:MAG TPA: phosphate regulon sensor histidine kinase PhoR [Rhodocyclaceae bacterium]|nr:phosphate regulon sensor histidine kinase PhoR [Rhodocyclaceae bacterium]HMV20450.1 phosphate regulon sensor histidine kinase PhoR [Rhodocyclaceae bacterium]HNE44277.1 phosphate regulon sensor histidine kinase PhoR [Rhodocyclaceae bacterium]HNM80429.1 phosphate regulon sensor histidine kinase PhoR [Rhodocyclaceae bacterium]HNP03570.1 phosphate regulon sensor histidine kinase PhoR [Rhodocyclaceae bacterium]